MTIRPHMNSVMFRPEAANVVTLVLQLLGLPQDQSVSFP
jgi:hypothetical protein